MLVASEVQMAGEGASCLPMRMALSFSIFDVDFGYAKREYSVSMLDEGKQMGCVG
jgi:hypothetical protein